MAEDSIFKTSSRNIMTDRFELSPTNIMQFKSPLLKNAPSSRKRYTYETKFNYGFGST